MSQKTVREILGAEGEKKVCLKKEVKTHAGSSLETKSTTLCNYLFQLADLRLNGEELLFHVVLHLLTNEVCGNVGIGVLEASALDSRTINREGVVVKELGIEVGGERSAGDTGSLAHLTPWLKVLVVNILDNILEVNTSDIAGNGTIETSVDAKDLFEDLVDLLLVGVVLIGNVVKSTGRNVDGAVPHGSSDITHVDSAETKITSPHELHLLLEVLVNSSADDARSNAVNVTRAVDSGRTKDDERKTRESLKISLSLEVSLGEDGPGFSLVTLLRRLLASSIDLSSAEVDELLDGVLDSLLSDLHAHIMELLLIDGLILTILGFSSAVEDVVKLLAVVASEALGDGASVGEVTLNEVDDGVGEEGGVSGVEESSLREDLIDAADFSDCASLHEVLTKVTADEASATKNKNGCHCYCL